MKIKGESMGKKKETVKEKDARMSQEIVGKGRKIQAGEKEIVLASEEVQTRNITSMMIFGNETRKMIKECVVIINALQNRMISQKTEIDELRRQLSILQGEFYKRGTVSYTGDSVGDSKDGN